MYSVTPQHCPRHICKYADVVVLTVKKFPDINLCEEIFSPLLQLFIVFNDNWSIGVGRPTVIYMCFLTSQLLI